MNDRGSMDTRGDHAQVTVHLNRPKTCFTLVGTLVCAGGVAHFRSSNGLYFNIARQGSEPRPNCGTDHDETFDRLAASGPRKVCIRAQVAGDFSLAVHHVEAWPGHAPPADQATLERMLVINALCNQSRRKAEQRTAQAAAAV